MFVINVNIIDVITRSGSADFNHFKTDIRLNYIKLYSVNLSWYLTENSPSLFSKSSHFKDV